MLCVCNDNVPNTRSRSNTRLKGDKKLSDVGAPGVLMLCVWNDDVPNTFAFANTVRASLNFRLVWADMFRGAASRFACGLIMGHATRRKSLRRQTSR